jgi:biopolymer transport protein ExbB/TolQ
MNLVPLLLFLAGLVMILWLIAEIIDAIRIQRRIREIAESAAWEWCKEHGMKEFKDLRHK